MGVFFTEIGDFRLGFYEEGGLPVEWSKIGEGCGGVYYFFPLSTF